MTTSRRRAILSAIAGFAATEPLRFAVTLVTATGTQLLG